MSEGYCKIHRQLFDNEIWLLEPFTRGQAWIDLFANANFKDSSFFIRGNEIKIKRGQIGWSEVTMAKRWMWGRNKVRGFLAWLENRGQIRQQKIYKLTTIIDIINYDKYQSEQQTIQQKDNRKTTDDTQLINDNNVKNEKKEELSEISANQKEILNVWKQTMGGRYLGSKELDKNISYWLNKGLTLQEIIEAVKKIPSLVSGEVKGNFWHNMSPTLFFRQKNSQGESDYIFTALNAKTVKGNTSDELISLMNL